MDQRWVWGVNLYSYEPKRRETYSIKIKDIQIHAHISMEVSSQRYFHTP
jgi:hypothetical protein